MSCHLRVSWIVALAIVLMAPLQPLGGQENRMARGGVRFIMAAWSPPREIDTQTAPALQRRVTLGPDSRILREALREITRQADLEISYSPNVVPLSRPIRLHIRDRTVAAALTELLAGLSVDVAVTPNGGLALIKRPLSTHSPADSGSISGRVTDRRSSSPLPGATIIVNGTTRSATTDAQGQFRIPGLAAGEYIVRARYIGYTPLEIRVVVTAVESPVVSFELDRSAQELDQVVVTGTLVPTEVKALPSPVTVVDESDIATQRPQNIQELFRKAVPGAVSWNSSSAPYGTEFSVRGASSLVPTSASMKVLIDGIETANAGLSQVDPASIARVEVIRGPQAAAIYGSEAIGGVIQIFTKRGDAERTRPTVTAEASAGVVQTPYAGFRDVARQEYRVSIRGGALGAGYHLGAGYSHLGSWLPPEGEVSRQISPSVHGGVNLTRGALALDISGRYLDQRGGNNLSDPAIFETGYVPYSRPYYQPHRSQNLTVGTQVSVTPRPWWHTTLRLGVDRRSVDVAQLRPRLTTPDDSLLQVSNRAETKPSVALNTAIEGTLASGVTGSATVGVDYWSYTAAGFTTFDALTTSGSIRLVPGASVFVDRSVTRNTGYFAQVQAGFRDAVFATVGLRAERNTDFGDSLGTPLLPRFGLTYVRTLGLTTVKLRGSWGRAIKPPAPGAKVGFKSSFRDQLPNPNLGPERQRGWDAGFDVTIGSRGALGFTYYDQIADNLIDRVVHLTPVQTQQYQNVGRVRNRGVEVEGTFAAGGVRLQGQYGYARARVESLSPTYSGDLQIGDQVHLRPKHTFGLSATTPLGSGTTISGGVVYLGSWTNTDLMALIRCFGGTGPCLPTDRDYLIRFPALLKVNATITQRLNRALTGFVSIDNLTNNDRHEADNISPVMGRTTTLGARLEY